MSLSSQFQPNTGVISTCYPGDQLMHRVSDRFVQQPPGGAVVWSKQSRALSRFVHHSSAARVDAGDCSATASNSQARLQEGTDRVGSKRFGDARSGRKAGPGPGHSRRHPRPRHSRLRNSRGAGLGGRWTRDLLLRLLGPATNSRRGRARSTLGCACRAKEGRPAWLRDAPRGVEAGLGGSACRWSRAAA
jgi:hypothetical protein